MEPDDQLAFDIAFDTTVPRSASAPPKQAARPEPETRGRLSSLAGDAERAQQGLPRAQALTQLAVEVEAALTVSVLDAYRQHHSWRGLSAELQIPFQTLRRRYAHHVKLD